MSARDKANQIKEYVSRLPFEDKLPSKGADAARALTEAVIKMDSWYPEIRPTVLVKQHGEFVLAFSGFKTEIDLGKAYHTLLGAQRRKMFRCVRGVNINFGVGTITLSIAPLKIAPPLQQQLSRRQRQPRFRGDEDLLPSSSSSSFNVGLTSINVPMSAVDVESVASHEKAIVAKAAIGVLYFHGSEAALETGRKPCIVETADRHAYKAIFYDLNAELNLADLYQRMLGPVAERNNHFSIVLNAGLEPGIPALVVRLGKQQSVSGSSSSSSTKQLQPQPPSTDAVLSAISRRVKHSHEATPHYGGGGGTMSGNRHDRHRMT